jgi:hypothetical protein
MYRYYQDINQCCRPAVVALVSAVLDDDPHIIAFQPVSLV